MSRKGKAKSQAISIYLLKEGTNPDKNVPDRNVFTLDVGTNGPIQQCDCKIGELFWVSLEQPVPWWKDYLGINVDFSSVTHGAILFLKTTGRHFAVTFGRVTHLLKHDVIEQDFGLNVTKRSVDLDALSAMEVVRPEDSRRQRMQYAKETEIMFSGVEFDENILKKLSGRTNDNYRTWFSRVTGTDSVRVNTNQDAKSLVGLCQKLLETKGTAQELPGSVFGLCNDSEIDKCDKKLLAIIRQKKSPLYFSVPKSYDDMIVNDMSVGKTEGSLCTETIREFFTDKLKDKDDAITIDFLKKVRVCLRNTDKEIVKNFSLYSCLSYTCVVKKKAYFLCDGKWYKIESALRDIIQEELNPWFCKDVWTEYKLPPIGLNDDGHLVAEEKYNEDLEGKNGYLCLDQCFLQGKIEACDLCRMKHGTLELVHIKKYGGPSNLSHLFNQGVVSARKLKRDEKAFDEFKDMCLHPEKRNEKRGKNWQCKLKIPDYRKVKYKVVYGIIRENGKRDKAFTAEGLTIFSMITLRNAIVQLTGLGIEVSWGWIRVQ